MQKHQEKIIFAVCFIFTLSVYGSMAMMSIGAGFVFAGYLLYLIPVHQHPNNTMKWFKNPLWKPTLVLSIACVWSLLWAKYTRLQFHGMTPEIQLGIDSKKLWHLFFIFVFAQCLSVLSKKNFDRVLRVWLFSASCMAVFGLIQYHFPIYKPQALPHLNYDTYVKGEGLMALIKGSYHATGMAGFHLSFATIFAFPTTVIFAYFGLKYVRDGWTRQTRILGLLSLAFFTTIMLTYSKIIWFAMPILVVAMAFKILKGRIRYVLLGLTVLLAIVGVQSSEFKLRFQGTDTIKERLEVWRANIEMVKQFPLFGVGWHHNADLSEAYYKSIGKPGFVSHAHNNFLDQIASTGLFGLLSFIWWNIVVVGLAVRMYKNVHISLYRIFAIGFIGGWVCLHLSGVTQTNFWDAKVMHQISWVAAVTVEMWRRNTSQIALRAKAI